MIVAPGAWQDWIVDPRPDPERFTADREESDLRQRALREALETLNDRERYIFLQETWSMNQSGWKIWRRSLVCPENMCAR